MTRNKKGFTLIELLVVIAIIGVLASVVLASLNSARRKSRDSRRIADIKQLQLALEMYFDANSSYPAALTALTPTYIPTIPKDPIGATDYPYYQCSSTKYHLGAGLEESSNPALQSDLNSVPSDCSGSPILSGNETNNATAVCAAGTGRSCYDVTP